MTVFEEPIVGLAACQLISQGAEARVYETTFLGLSAVMKQRFSKKYRNSVLDVKLTTTRMKQEVRSMLKARKLGILTPVVYNVEMEASTIYMEKILGSSVKDILRNSLMDSAGVQTLMADIGRVVAKLHDGGLVHGDLTTSNMMVRSSDGALVLIDFGLSFNSTLPEDKGVDLYVLERAFTSAHSTCGDLFATVMEAYKKNSKQWSSTYNRYAEVRLRGRKRAMVG